MPKKFVLSQDQFGSIFAEASEKLPKMEGHYASTQTIRYIMYRYGWSTESVEKFIASMRKVRVKKHRLVEFVNEKNRVTSEYRFGSVEYVRVK